MSRVVEGVALAAGAAAMYYAAPYAAPIAMAHFFNAGGVTILSALGAMGAGQTLQGISDLLHGGPGQSASVRQPVAPRQCIYGQVRVTGTPIYMSTTGHQLNHIIVWSSHPCYSIDAVYLDGRQAHCPLPTQATPWAGGNDNGGTYEDAAGNKYKFAEKLAIFSHLGSDAGHWSAEMHGNDGSWSNTCTVNGCCYSYVKCTYSSGLYSGLPGIKATIRGKCDIYDPRTGKRGYTNNAALVIADFLCNSMFGLGCDWDEIDEDQLIAAANICDEQVLLANGLYESRYTINGVFDTNATPGDVLQSMLSACEGRITYKGGRFGIYPAAWYGTGMSYDASNLLDSVKWNQKKFRDRFNTVRATYVSPRYPYAVIGYNSDVKDDNIFSGEWQPTDAPEYAQDADHGYATDANLAEDGGVKLYTDVRYQFVTSVAQVQRCMKIRLLRSRQMCSGTLTCDLSLYQTCPQDVNQWTFEPLGWAGKYLETQNIRFVPKVDFDKPDEAPAIQVELDVGETDPSIYSWSPVEERTVQNTDSPVMDDAFQVAAPTNLTIENDSTTALLNADGTATQRMLITWTEPDDPFVTSGGTIQVEYQSTTDSGWTSAASVSGETTRVYLSAPGELTALNFRARSVRASGAYSDWVTVENWTTEPYAYPAPTSVTITLSTMEPS